jgi:shikimate kinase
VFLSGFMAAGKTTTGRELAHRLGVPFVDLDASIVRRAGRPIADLFALHGEEVFRDLESAELMRVAAIDPVVVALGGGTLERPANRRLVEEAGVLVWLDTPRSTILSRLDRACSRTAGSGAIRPLGRDRATVIELLDRRRSTYEHCHHRLRPGDDEPPSRTAERVAALIAADTVR